MKADMSPRAVTVRLLRTAQLRRLCLALRRAPGPSAPTTHRGDGAPQLTRRRAVRP
jgi:hypothetical protein